MRRMPRSASSGRMRSPRPPSTRIVCVPERIAIASPWPTSKNVTRRIRRRCAARTSGTIAAALGISSASVIATARLRLAQQWRWRAARRTPPTINATSGGAAKHAGDAERRSEACRDDAARRSLAGTRDERTPARRRRASRRSAATSAASRSSRRGRTGGSERASAARWRSPRRARCPNGLRKCLPMKISAPAPAYVRWNDASVRSRGSRIEPHQRGDAPEILDRRRAFQECARARRGRCRRSRARRTRSGR